MVLMRTVIEMMMVKLVIVVPLLVVVMKMVGRE